MGLGKLHRRSQSGKRKKIPQMGAFLCDMDIAYSGDIYFPTGICANDFCVKGDLYSLWYHESRNSLIYIRYKRGNGYVCGIYENIEEKIAAFCRHCGHGSSRMFSLIWTRWG